MSDLLRITMLSTRTEWSLPNRFREFGTSEHLMEDRSPLMEVINLVALRRFCHPYYLVGDGFSDAALICICSRGHCNQVMAQVKRVMSD